MAGHGASACNKGEPSKSTPDPANARATVDRIRAEEMKSKAVVEREVRRSIKQDKVDAGSLGAVASPMDGEPARAQGSDAGIEPGASASISGKLETSEPSQLILRDGDGFRYRLRTDDRTRVTYNGKAVRLDQFKQGTEVRAGYEVDGQEKVATDVEVLQPR